MKKQSLTKHEKVDLALMLTFLVVISGLLWWACILPYIDAFARVWAPLGIM